MAVDLTRIRLESKPDSLKGVRTVGVGVGCARVRAGVSELIESSGKKEVVKGCVGPMADGAGMGSSDGDAGVCAWVRSAGVCAWRRRIGCLIVCLVFLCVRCVRCREVR